MSVIAGLWLTSLIVLPASFVPPPKAGLAQQHELTDLRNVESHSIKKHQLQIHDTAKLQLTTGFEQPVAKLAPVVGALAAGLGASAGASALMTPGALDLNPDSFRPVCPASDSIYNLGKTFADAALGAEGAEYRPLAIEALLRVRLEICVLESFVYEAIVPFVQRKGLGWILPAHETIDTVIAGTVFAVALNFILFGTTKILSVISIYHDFLIGAPLRLIGFAVFPEKRAVDVPLIQINCPGTAPAPTPQQEESGEEEERDPPPLPLAIFGGVCKGYGIISEIIKTIFETLDTFVARYLAVTSILYIVFKWAHFRVFPDFPPI